MTETGIVALVGFAATLLSGLGASWLTNRSARQRDLDARSALAKAELRGAVVQTLIAGREWCGSAIGVMTGLARVEDANQLHPTLRDLMANSQAGKDFSAHGPILIAQLTDTQLRVGDGPLSDALQELKRLRESWWIEVVEPLSSTLRSADPSFDARARIIDRYSTHLEVAIKRIEHQARADLAGA